MDSLSLAPTESNLEIDHKAVPNSLDIVTVEIASKEDDRCRTSYFFTEEMWWNLNKVMAEKIARFMQAADDRLDEVDSSAIGGISSDDIRTDNIRIEDIRIEDIHADDTDSSDDEWAKPMDPMELEARWKELYDLYHPDEEEQ